MSMPRAVRHINEIRVLDALFRQGKMSRADIARKLGLTRSTASSLVAGLRAEGFILEDKSEHPRDLRIGRRGTFVRLNARHAVFIGADIGVNSITLVALDLETTILAELREQSAMAHLPPQIIIDRLSAMIGQLLAQLPEDYQVRALCVSVPGIVNPKGMVLRAPILGWSHVPVLDMLAATLPGLPVRMAENDANAFAMAELYKAGDHAPRSALYLFMDAGVGGAIVSSGDILHGHNGYAGELGHIILGDKGFDAGSPLPGSLESFVGRNAILARWRFHGGAGTDLDAFLKACAHAEPAAIATSQDWAACLGRALASLTSIFNPEKMILGGPVSALFHYAERDIMQAWRQNLLPGHPVPQIAVSSLGANGPAIGAASILHKHMFCVNENLIYRGTGNG